MKTAKHSCLYDVPNPALPSAFKKCDVPSDCFRMCNGDVENRSDSFQGACPGICSAEVPFNQLNA